jgi:hypothetical protein
LLGAISKARSMCQIAGSAVIPIVNNAEPDARHEVFGSTLSTR